MAKISLPLPRRKAAARYSIDGRSVTREELISSSHFLFTGVALFAIYVGSMAYALHH
ncbi:MAG: hypothetical protein ABI884_13920 [Gemmatimonadota bacterium]